MIVISEAMLSRPKRGGRPLVAGERRPSFLKKRSKKLLLIAGSADAAYPTNVGGNRQKFFGSFF
jgi:hypothetical protein